MVKRRGSGEISNIYIFWDAIDSNKYVLYIKIFLRFPAIVRMTYLFSDVFNPSVQMKALSNDLYRRRLISILMFWYIEQVLFKVCSTGVPWHFHDLGVDL